MQLLNKLSLVLLASTATSAFAAAIDRELNVVERASNPSQQCVQAEKYLGIYNGIYSAACAELVSPLPLSLPCTFHTSIFGRVGDARSLG